MNWKLVDSWITVLKLNGYASQNPAGGTYQLAADKFDTEKTF